MTDLHNPLLARLHYDTLTDSWKYTEQGVIHRIEGGDLAMMKSSLEQQAHTNLAFQRGDILAAIAATRWNPAIKHLLTGAVGVFGAIVIGGSVSSIVDSTGRGPVAAAGGAIAGGVCAVLTDVYSSRYMMKRRMRYNSLQALDRIQAELATRLDPTEFEMHYSTSQQQLLHQVEALYLEQEPKSEALMALAAICTEGLVSLVLTFPAGLPLALASATFPIVVNLLVAKVQSDRFEVPEACENLIPTYEVHRPEATILAQEALAVERLHAALEYVAQARPPKGLRSVGQAKGKSQMHFAQARMAELEQQGRRALVACEHQYQADLAALAQQCPPPDLDTRGLTAAEAQQAVAAWCQCWLTAAEQTLAAQYQREAERIHTEYSAAIASWRTVEAQGAQEYRDSEPEDHLPGAA